MGTSFSLFNLPKVETPEDRYVLGVIDKYSLPTGPQSPAYQVGHDLYPIIKAWAGEYLFNVYFSGSYAKRTGVKGSTDLDLFISLIPQTSETLKEMYDKLYAFLVERGFGPKKQNVSINISVRNISVDLIPGKKYPGNCNDHSLFINKKQSWTKTNINIHIDMINNSGRVSEIKAVKIWRNIHNLNFPSFYLELSVLRALRGAKKNQPSTNVLKVFRYFTYSFLSSRVLDPANSNNVISNDLTLAEKRIIIATAKWSLTRENWGQIIW